MRSASLHLALLEAASRSAAIIGGDRLSSEVARVDPARLVDPLAKSDDGRRRGRGDRWHFKKDYEMRSISPAIRARFGGAL